MAWGGRTITRTVVAYERRGLATPATVPLRPGDALHYEAAAPAVGIQGAHHRDLVTQVKTCLVMQQDMMGIVKNPRVLGCQGASAR